jgi:septal ring factor EnvC (AmiA/AmiB activator)
MRQSPPGRDFIRGRRLDAVGQRRQRVLARLSAGTLARALAKLEDAYEICAQACETNRQQFWDEEQRTQRLRARCEELRNEVAEVTGRMNVAQIAKGELEVANADLAARLAQEQEQLMRERSESFQRNKALREQAGRFESTLLNVLRDGFK